MRILRKRGETIFTCGKLRGRDGYCDGNDNVFIMENCLNLVYNKILFGCLHNLQYIPRIQYQKCGGGGVELMEVSEKMGGWLMWVAIDA